MNTVDAEQWTAIVDFCAYNQRSLVPAKQARGEMPSMVSFLSATSYQLLGLPFQPRTETVYFSLVIVGLRSSLPYIRQLWQSLPLTKES